MTLSEERRGEIAMLMVKRQLRKGGIPVVNLRDVKNAAKELGVPYEEYQAFLKPLFLGLIEEGFGKKEDDDGNNTK